MDRKPTFLKFAREKLPFPAPDAMLTSLYNTLNREEKNRAFIIEICSELSLCCMGAKSHINLLLRLICVRTAPGNSTTRTLFVSSILSCCCCECSPGEQ